MSAAELRARHDARIQAGQPHGKPALAIESSDTSRAAAASVEPRRGRLQAVVLATLVGSAMTGLTDEQGIRITGLSPSTYRPRRIELVEAGRVVDSGKRRRTVSGRWAVVWIVA